MAYDPLSSLAQTIDQILHHPQYSLSPRKEQLIMSIHDYVKVLLQFLEDFQQEGHSLEGRIRDASHRAEDMIEYFMWEQIHSSLNAKNSILFAKPRHRHHFHFVKLHKEAKKLDYVAKEPMNTHNSFRMKDEQPGDFSATASLSVGTRGMLTKHWLHFDFEELDKVASEFKSIAGEAMGIKNSFRIKDEQPCNFLAAASSSRAGLIDKNDVVGFDDDLMALKTQLCGESSKLRIIPITGMGGIGKTTLARSAYDDQLITEYFDIRVWFTVSQDYSREEIFSKLTVSLKASNEEDVYKSLKGKRYLIVMDDIWSIEPWDDVRRIFPDDNNGSRIILTTRLLDVAIYVNPSGTPHKMSLMDEDQSWNLLQQRVFTGEECPPGLVAIGRKIARSCRGLALAIVVIAGVLSRVSKTITSWHIVARNVNQIVTANDEQFADSMLSLSYNHLPHHLRCCFLYMSAFPEDDEIPVSILIKLWVAEGFLKPSGSESFEEKAEQCLDDLVKRSLVLVIKRKANGTIKTCSLHDLVRELCIRKAREEKFLTLEDKASKGKGRLESLKNMRRISSLHCTSFDNLENCYGSAIRTLMHFRYVDGFSFNRNLRLLRVLEVINRKEDSRVLMPDVFHLFHLRYLAFNHCMEIPAAISNLQNLQTLIIFRASSSEEDDRVCLPAEIWKLPKLKHLVFQGFGSFPSPPRPTFSLENLQTLSQVIDLECTREMVKMIPNLKKLGIYYSDGKELFQENHIHNLGYLHQLEKLKITTNLRSVCHPKFDLVFPVTLRKLNLNGLRLPWKEMAIVGSLPNLEVLILERYAFHGKNWETTEGEFLRLKFLRIDKSELKHWITESSHFPSLKYLQLYYCVYLTEIPEGIGEIPTLERIEVDRYIKSLVESAKRIQEEQQSFGNDALRIRIV